MRIFIRSFNRHVSGKLGTVCPEDKKRDGYWWEKFEDLLKECLIELGHDVIEQPENVNFPDYIDDADYKIYVHGTKKEFPDVDYFYMQMHLADMFVFDERGWGVDHSTDINQEDYESVDQNIASKWVNSIAKIFLKRGESKHKQKRRSQFLFDINRILSGVPSGYLLAPLQIPRDYTILEHSPVSVLEFIHIVGEWAGENKVPLVYKLHPYNSQDKNLIDAIKTLTERYKTIHTMEGNIHQLIHRSSGVIVINSGVGFEALFHHKPVMTFGNCDYKNITHSITKDSLDSIEKYIKKYDKKMASSIDRFLYYYCHKHGYMLRESEFSETKIRLKNYLQNRL